MKIIPVGYGNPKHRPLIEQLMHEDNTLLVDVRYSKASAIPGWHGASLVKRFGERYIYLGRTLGNKNYKNGGLISIVDMEGGIFDLMPVLRDGYTVLLLCGCSQYGPSKEHPEGCHRKRICEALAAYSTEIEIVLPETIIARDQALESLRDEREALYMRLNDIEPSMADYWRLPVAQQSQVRQQIGRR